MRTAEAGCSLTGDKEGDARRHARESTGPFTPPPDRSRRAELLGCAHRDRPRSALGRLSTVLIHHAFRSVPDRLRGTAYHPGGRRITDEDGSYCALGEAVNGPGGCFGRNLDVCDALEDCPRGTRGAKPRTPCTRHVFGAAGPPPPSVGSDPGPAPEFPLAPTSATMAAS